MFAISATHVIYLSKCVHSNNTYVWKTIYKYIHVLLHICLQYYVLLLIYALNFVNESIYTSSEAAICSLKSFTNSSFSFNFTFSLLIYRFHTVFHSQLEMLFLLLPFFLHLVILVCIFSQMSINCHADDAKSPQTHD